MAYTYRIIYLLIAPCLLPVYEPLYLAREVGYFWSDAVHLVEFTSMPQVVQTYRNKVIQAPPMTLDEALLVNQYVGSAKLLVSCLQTPCYD